MAGPDTTDPMLTSAILPNVDVTSAGETVTFSVGALDTGSGVDRVYLYFDHSWEGRSGLESVVALTDATDSFSDGQSAASVYFDSATAAGTYSITSVMVYDKAGNWTQYSAADLSALGIATSFNVLSDTPADTISPTLTSVSLPSVDVSAGGETVTFSAGAFDSGSGVDRVELYFDHNWEGQSGLGSIVTLSDAADSFADGSSATSVYFDPRTPGGTYAVTSAIVYDKAGNYTQYSSDQLAEMGIPTSFAVLSNTPADTSSPTLTSASFPTVDITAGGELVTFSAGALDTGTGVDRVYFNFDHSWHGQTGLESSVLLSDASDSFADGVSETSVYFDPLTAAGTYNVSSAIVYDKAGNFTEYSPAQLADVGIPTSFAVADRNVVPTAFVTAPATLVEGRDTSGAISLTLVDLSQWTGTVTMSFAAANSTAIDGMDFAVPSFSSTYSVTQSPSDYTITLPSISLLGDQRHDGTEILALTIRASGQIFASGTDTITLNIALIDEPIAHNDFNGDGRSDILWRNDSGYLTEWVANADGSFTSNEAHAGTGAANNSWQVAGTGDFNGDGINDILWRNPTSGYITEWLGTSTGGFTSNEAQAGNGSADPSWQIAGIADFNGDGISDILWRSTGGYVTEWLGTSSGGFVSNEANAGTGVADTSWQVAGTGDFNGDGISDILWRNAGGYITEWLGTSTGGFVSNQGNAGNGSADTSWQIAGTGDFNGDGMSDILWRYASTGYTTEWVGTSTGGFTDNAANAATGAADNSWQVVSIGDFNHDSIDDLLWRNSSGYTTEWLGTASGGFTDNAAVAASGAADTNWHVQDPFF